RQAQEMRMHHCIDREIRTTNSGNSSKPRNEENSLPAINCRSAYEDISPKRSRGGKRPST
ncbi:MAG: hypothetical protein ABI196_11300, partial [Bradyrhizobium sp.]